VKQLGFIVATVCGMALLSGCATTPTPVVPSQLLSCSAQPKAPTAGTQRTVALYIIDLAAAGDDCRDKLGSVRRILMPENTP
jgi:hypothetical protein